MRSIITFFSDIFYSVMIKDWEKCKFEIKLIAIAIYTDEKVKKSEIGEATKILKEEYKDEFTVEVFDVLIDRITDKIDDYKSNLKLFIKERDEVIDHILNIQDRKKALILKKIFHSDNELSEKEKRILVLLNEIIEK